jgi:small multidrug resistance family-3 protein
MSVAKSLVLFVVAAVAEIGGAWLVWQGVREHRGIAWVGGWDRGARCLWVRGDIAG